MYFLRASSQQQLAPSALDSFSAQLQSVDVALKALVRHYGSEERLDSVPIAALVLDWLWGQVLLAQHDRVMFAAKEFAARRLRLNAEHVRHLWNQLNQLCQYEAAEEMLQLLKETNIDCGRARREEEEEKQLEASTVQKVSIGKKRQREHNGVPVFTVDELVELAVELAMAYADHFNAFKAQAMLQEANVMKWNFYEPLLDAIKTDSKHRRDFLELIQMVREKQLDQVFGREVMAVLAPELFRVWIYLMDEEVVKSEVEASISTPGTVEGSGYQLEWFVKEMKRLDLLVNHEDQMRFSDILAERWILNNPRPEFNLTNSIKTSSDIGKRESERV